MDVQLLLVPYDTALRGWRMGAGPEHLMRACLAGELAALGHRVEATTLTPDPGHPPAEIGTAFELMRLVADATRAALAAGRFPLLLSGSCSMASGVLAALSPRSRAIFWFDAHGDCNTPDTSASGFFDGMALATALGRCWPQLAASIPGFQPVPDRSTLLLGARQLDPLEAELLSRSAVAVLPPSDVRTSRFSAELARLRGAVEAGYVHCDLDVLDPAEGRANPMAVRGGLALAEVVAAVRAIGAAVPVSAAAISAYAPECDPDGRVSRAAFAIVAAMLAAASGG